MQYSDEKDYLMRMIKEAARVIFSVVLGKGYTQVEPENENKYEVSGRRLDTYKDMVDQGHINEAENLLLEEIDYQNKDEVAAAVLLYRYIGEKDEAFLRANGYSKEEALYGLRQLAAGAGYSGVWEAEDMYGEAEGDGISAGQEPPREEPARQYYFMEKCRQLVQGMEQELGRRPTFFTQTFGCQMNARDSEKLSGILKSVGYEPADSEEADFVIYNTCTVRENANNKVWGRLGYLNAAKKRRPHMKIALCGCMMQEPEVIERLKKGYPFVSLIFGTHNIYKFAELLFLSLQQEGTVIDVWQDTDRIVEDLPIERKYHFKSGVNIMFGCNNFCSYCIVPYVRGRERSRRPEDIIREIRQLAEDGVVEVMLLGQNVNSYGKGLEPPVTFAKLLREVEKIEGISRIRFMTSHPKDLSDELIEAMGASDKICRHLHLPLQSGSSRILKEMNRRYDKEQYLALVEKIRKAAPGIALTTDIIVGFPGETEEDFQETLDVVRRVGFDSAFTFLYSKRTGTPAAAMESQVPEVVAKNRFDRLLREVQRIASQKAKALTGRVEPVLVEEVNGQDESLVTGRLSNNFIVHFPGDESLVGKIVDVELKECKGFYFYGKAIM